MFRKMITSIIKWKEFIYWFEILNQFKKFFDHKKAKLSLSNKGYNLHKWKGFKYNRKDMYIYSCHPVKLDWIVNNIDILSVKVGQC